MIAEITKYKAKVGVTEEELLLASNSFNENFCARCNGLIRRHLLKTDEGLMDIFLWETRADVEKMQATFMKDSDALAFAEYLDPNSISMIKNEVLDVYESPK